MNISKTLLSISMGTVILFSACKKDESPETSDDTQQAQLGFEFKFDETLPRLGNFGEEVDIPAGNAGQSPSFREMSAHYIELAQDSLTALGSGEIVYHAPETDAGGESAVDFDQSIVAGEGTKFLTVNISDLEPGTYRWIRASVSYQRYDVSYYLNLPPYIDGDYTGTVSSFFGFNTYITTHTVDQQSITVNDDKKQGYWAFETSVEGYSDVTTGQSEGTTVVNPIALTSPVPAGSCVVTGKLAEPLVITGNETEDIEVVLAFSINNSFEWEDTNPDGKWEPEAGETVVDMGLRGLHPYAK